jgi:beta-galactosidase/beta-glucuronidase
VVTTYKDDNGWKLQVNGQDHYIKGVVWGYSPKGQNYSYNLWGESDDFISKVLDYEFTLMKAAGINTIRSFSFVPPKWVTYVYREYGIMTAINPLMGRYGYNIGGKWVPFTDYSDPLTRATLKADMLKIVNEYKDVPGVIMFAFGNESNYGLSWSGFEIENLPEGEQNTEKARYLYSLFNEVIKEGKAIAPTKPFTIVNGDIQYIDLIAELCPDLDLLGSNVYRGESFTSLWKDVDEKLDLPVVFFEFGSDAFNAREYREDQLSQAKLLKLQWQEMYNKAYGNGEEGNSIGGFVFEWRDEWWKYLQEENLDVQDNNASWSNQAYLFDWAEGQNNMNEEWFGITALGKKNADGVYTRRSPGWLTTCCPKFGLWIPTRSRNRHLTRRSARSTWKTWGRKTRSARSRVITRNRRAGLRTCARRWDRPGPRHSNYGSGAKSGAYFGAGPVDSLIRIAPGTISVFHAHPQ